MSLTEQQLLAAHDTARVVRLVAGPGTGKSKTIEERVAWLLRQDIRPNGIYGMSFTRFASEDLSSRIKQFCTEQGLGPQAKLVRISTAHSLALWILKKANLLSRFYVDPK
jgi:superfamily I DNA/RNA helicase